jgi:hypothetical protein
MRIFAKIRQVYDRLCERKEARADRMRQEREHLSERRAWQVLGESGAPVSGAIHESPNTRRKRQLAVERDSKLLGADFGSGG